MSSTLNISQTVLGTSCSQSVQAPSARKECVPLHKTSPTAGTVSPTLTISQTETSYSQNVPTPIVRKEYVPVRAGCENFEQEALSYEDFQRRIFKEIQSLKVGFTKLVQSIERNKCQCTKDEETIESEDFLQYFPLKTVADVGKMETILDKNGEYKTGLIITLSRIGGNKVDEITKLILRKLFIDELAKQYSWMGAKKKLVFSNLMLSDVILKAVRKNQFGKNSTEKEMIDSIKNWLRHADARTKNKKREFQKENRMNPENIEVEDDENK